MSLSSYHYIIILNSVQLVLNIILLICLFKEEPECVRCSRTSRITVTEIKSPRRRVSSSGKVKQRRKEQ